MPYYTKLSDGRHEKIQRRREMSQAGLQPKVGGKKREHVGVVDVPANRHPIQQDAFIVCADLLSHAFAALIPLGNDDLGADQLEAFEGKFCGQHGGAPRNAAAVLRGAHPVAQVAKLVDGVNVAEAAPAKQFAGIGIGDGKGIMRAAGPVRPCDDDEPLGGDGGVIIGRPAHPGMKLLQRFPDRVMKCVRFAKFERTQGDRTIGEFDEWQHDNKKTEAHLCKSDDSVYFSMAELNFYNEMYSRRLCSTA